MFTWQNDCNVIVEANSATIFRIYLFTLDRSESTFCTSLLITVFGSYGILLKRILSNPRAMSVTHNPFHLCSRCLTS